MAQEIRTTGFFPQLGPDPDEPAVEPAALDALVDAAVADGRIATTSRVAWREAIDPARRSPAVARAEQESLARLARPGMSSTGWFNFGGEAA